MNIQWNEQPVVWDGQQASWGEISGPVGVVSFIGPAINSFGGVTGTAITPLDISARFSDSESEALTFSAVGSWPSGVVVTPAGVIQGTPTVSGTYTGLTVRATNESGAIANSNPFNSVITDEGTEQPIPLIGLLQIWTGDAWFNVNDGTFQVWTGSEWVLL